MRGQNVRAALRGRRVTKAERVMRHNPQFGDGEKTGPSGDEQVRRVQTGRPLPYIATKERETARPWV